MPGASQGGHFEHAKAPGEIRVLCPRNGHSLAERVGVSDLGDGDERAGGDVQRHDQPVVAIDHPELRHAEACEIVRLRVEPAEVHLAIFKLPVAIGWHAGKTQRRRHDIELVFLGGAVLVLVKEKSGLRDPRRR